MAGKAETGVRVCAAVERTGLTQRQLLYRVAQGTVRFCRVGRFVELHPADVRALERGRWQGRPVAGAEEAGE